MIVCFLNLGTSLEDYNYENQAIADIIKNEIGDVQFMGMSVRRRKKTINVLGSSSIWTCRILNINYLLLFSIGKRSGKNQDKYSKFGTSKSICYQGEKFWSWIKLLIFRDRWLLAKKLAIVLHGPRLNKCRAINTKC